MTPIELLLAILSSSVLSGIVGAVIGGWFTLRGKRNDYANEYYKLVLARRVKAYEEVERLITSIKVAVMDKDGDGRPYHLLFSKEDDAEAAHKQLFSVMAQALWLTDELFALTREFNHIVFGRPDGQELIEFGKDNYRQIAELRTKMELVHVRDMLRLHAVPEFLQSKRPADSYVSVGQRD